MGKSCGPVRPWVDRLSYLLGRPAAASRPGTSPMPELASPSNCPARFIPYRFVILRKGGGKVRPAILRSGIFRERSIMALIFWRDRVLRGIFLASSVVFGTVVLLAHPQYTIDVAAAFFIAHSVFRIVGRYFDDPPSGFGALRLRQHSVEVRAQGGPQGRSG